MIIYFVTEKSDVKKESVDNSEGISIEEERVPELSEGAKQSKKLSS